MSAEWEPSVVIIFWLDCYSYVDVVTSNNSNANKYKFLGEYPFSLQSLERTFLALT